MSSLSSAKLILGLALIPIIGSAQPSTAQSESSQSPASVQNQNQSQDQTQPQTQTPAPNVFEISAQKQAENQAQFSAPAQNPDPQPQTRVINDGQFVPASGTIDGTNVKQFLNSGPDVNATQMEEASIPADNLMQMPDSAPKSPKPGKKKKKQGFFSAIGRGISNTADFLGFPLSNVDHDVDASLSSDLPKEVREAYGSNDPAAK